LVYAPRINAPGSQKPDFEKPDRDHSGTNITWQASTTIVYLIRLAAIGIGFYAINKKGVRTIGWKSSWRSGKGGSAGIFFFFGESVFLGTFSPGRRQIVGKKRRRKDDGK